MMKTCSKLLSLVVVFGLGGCAAGLSGVGGTSEYSCTAPEGVSCMSVSGLNANVTNRTLPAMQPRSELLDAKKAEAKTASEGKETKPVAYAGDKVASAGRVSPSSMDAPYSGQPIRTPPRVLRVWMAPFEDVDSDLHDQKYLYVTVHTGRWMLEANQVNVQRQFRQVYPLSRRDDDVPKNAAASAGGSDQSAAFVSRSAAEQRAAQTAEVE